MVNPLLGDVERGSTGDRVEFPIEELRVTPTTDR